MLVYNFTRNCSFYEVSRADGNGGGNAQTIMHLVWNSYLRSSFIHIIVTFACMMPYWAQFLRIYGDLVLNRKANVNWSHIISKVQEKLQMLTPWYNLSWLSTGVVPLLHCVNITMNMVTNSSCLALCVFQL